MEYNKKKVPTLEDGQVGIRATLNNMGFSDSQIGYDQTSSMVTLNGKNLLKPGYVDDNAGVSYASLKDIQSSIKDYYKNAGDPVVRVSDAYAGAAGKYGLSADALTYGDGTVSIGGKPIDILYIDDEGKSWARQSIVDSATVSYANSTGVMSPLDLAEEYVSKYLKDVKKLSNDLAKREFSYNPDDDPVFQAYKTKYLKEGARAGQEAMASYSALTGGYVNSAAATAGAQANQLYAQKISDAIPELAQMAYSRYIEKYQADLGLLNSTADAYNSAYKNLADANAKQIDGANLSASSNVERDANAWAQSWKELQNKQSYEQNVRDNYWNEILNSLSAENKIATTEGLILNNNQKRLYEQYYESLLKAELSGALLNNMVLENKLYK